MVGEVQSFINAVWGSTSDDKLLSTRQAITLRCFWHTASSRVSELHTAGKALTDPFRRVDGNSLNQSRQVQCWEKLRRRAHINGSFTGRGILFFLLDIQSALRSSAWITSMNNVLGYNIFVCSHFYCGTRFHAKKHCVYSWWPAFYVEAPWIWRCILARVSKPLDVRPFRWYEPTNQQVAHRRIKTIV